MGILPRIAAFFEIKEQQMWDLVNGYQLSVTNV